MTMTEAVKTVLAKYATFAGRAPRSEFWWWWLFTILAQIVASILDGILFGGMVGMDSYQGPNVISGLLGLVLLLPSLAVTVRRLHDVGRSGWWIFLGLVPVIGFLVLLYWYVQPSKPEGNRFG